MREGLTGVAFVDGNLAWVTVMPALQEVFIFASSRTQGYEESARLGDLVCNLANQVIALLRYQARDDGDDRPFRILWQVKPT